MSGYIGKGKSVVNVASYTKAQADDQFVNDPNSVISVSGSNVGIGNTNPDAIIRADSGTANKTLFKHNPPSNRYFSIADSSDGTYDNAITTFYKDATVGQFVFKTAAAERMRITSAGFVGIGTSSPSEKLVLANGSNEIKIGQDGSSHDIFSNGKTFNIGTIDDTVVRMFQNNSEVMRLSGGNLLVGTTDNAGTRYSATSGGGTVIQASSYSVFSRETTASNQAIMTINNTGVDATFTEFLKNGSVVGSIGTFGDDLTIGTGDTGFKFSDSSDGIMPFNVSTNAFRDDAIDLGHSSVRFDDIYATNGTIQTSDRNEKQDIQVLSDAETRVAQACKGLLRKFRWQDAVAEKGDDARIHFGIIAQDLQDAFAAEGLGAGRYAMFISSTWWETQTEVPAVEAVAEVLDDDGNVVTEAVEAKDAYTRTDTYETQAEAPEGATERTRLGVRYPELLAFIIGAM